LVDDLIGLACRDKRSHVEALYIKTFTLSFINQLPMANHGLPAAHQQGSKYASGYVE
jgi:hypothetical protein